MSVSVAASLVGTAPPRYVQVVVSGLTVGDAYEVRGNWDDGSWSVRAGHGDATSSSQLVLNDVQTPVNVPIWYTVRVNGADAGTSPAVTVDYQNRYVIQSLDGKTSAAFTWLDNGDPREAITRTAAFTIPGRPTPVVMYDIPAGVDGELAVSTPRLETENLWALVRSGAPVLLRTDGRVRDLEAVQFAHIMSVHNELSGAGFGTTEDRRWTLRYTVIADPEPNTLVPASTWDDFDAAYAGLTGAAFDADWAGLTGDAFDREDWALRAAQ